MTDAKTELGELRLTLIRHGEVSLPHSDILYGAHDVNLSATALVQIPRVALALSKSNPQVVLTSPLKRCATLARAVADLSGAKLIRDARLKERALGDWLLKRRGEMTENPDYHRWAAGDPDVQPAGGESLRMVQARALAALGPWYRGTGKGGSYIPQSSVSEYFAKAESQGPVVKPESATRIVWVSHGGVIRSWRCFVHDVDLAHSLKFAVGYFGCMEYARSSDGVWSEVNGEYQVF